MVNRQSAIDEPVVLGDLLGSDELREFALLYRRSYGVGMAISDRAGLLVSTAPDHDEIRAALASGAEPNARDDGGDGAGGAGAQPHRAFALCPLVYDGQRLAMIAIGPYQPPGTAAPDDADVPEMTSAQAETLVRHAAGAMEILVHHAYTRYLTSTVHSVAMEETFAELAAKNQRLEMAVEHMQEVDRLKSSFLATMSHELRTPLTSVIGYTEMLYEGLAGPLNGEQREYLQTILSKADQLLQLITGVLEASVLESGPVPLHTEPLALPEIIRNVVSGLGPPAQSRHITVVADQPDLPRALADGRRVRQVLRHLLTNAVKFTADRGDIRVEVQVGPLQRNGDVDDPRGLRVMVADAGIGIAAEKQEHIFEPFFQVDSSSTRRYGGTGLGLTLAKSYIEANGGQLWVQSTLGQGSVFTFSLPAVAEDLARFLARESTS